MGGQGRPTWGRSGTLGMWKVKDGRHGVGQGHHECGRSGTDGKPGSRVNIWGEGWR